MEITKRDPTVYTYCVEKINKRLWVVCYESGERIYTPPDFLLKYIHNRQPLIDLAMKMTTKASRIKRIIEFETSLRPNPQ